MRTKNMRFSMAFIMYCAALYMTMSYSVAAGENGPGPGSGPLPSVIVESVCTMDASEFRTFIGMVNGSETVGIVPRVAGTLQKVMFQEGSLVEKGDVLFEIEDTVYKANVMVAEALIAQCEADLALATKEHERSQALLQSRAIATQSFDTTLATQLLKKARLDEAKANLILTRHNYEHCRIISPISGRIGQKTLSEGSYITPSSGVLATVVQYQPIKVQFSMSESDFFRYFTSHDELKKSVLEIVRANGERYDGNIAVKFVDNMVDKQTDTIMITLECDNPKDQLLPGGFVQVRLAEKFDSPLPAVTVSALLSDGAKHYVYLVTDQNTVERRNVEVGELVHRHQVIRSGLRPGERVVTGGMTKTAPGMKINPVAEQP